MSVNELKPSSVMAFKEALNGSKGELDAWLECNNEDEVRAHINALLTEQPQASAAQVAELAAALERADVLLKKHEQRGLPDVSVVRASAAQSAPAGEREAAVEAAYTAVVEGGWSSVKEMGVEMFQAGAAWQRTQSAGVPEGWHIERTGNGDIIVRAEGVGGAVVSAEGTALRQIPEVILYHLAETMLAAAPAQPAAHDQGEVQRLREPTMAMVQAACAAFRMDISPMRAMHEALRAALAASTGQEVKP